MLAVENLSITFTMYTVGLVQTQLTVLTDVSLRVDAGEVVAVVGASGSGKSLLAHAILGILPANAAASGAIRFQGELLTQARKAALRGKQIALIPQSVGYLDPLGRIGRQVERAAQLNGRTPIAARAATDQAWTRYQLPAAVRRWFPFQVSGGMARRVLVSTAAVGASQLLIADEPTPGLNPDLVAETLGHLRELADAGRGVVLITHDITAALAVADRVVVLYAGTTVEVAAVRDFAGDGAALRHPYTRSLWQALPEQGFVALPGSQPSPAALPAGCLFAPRCPLASAECQQERPALRSVRGGEARCIHA